MKPELQQRVAEWHRRLDLIAAAKAYPELADLARLAEASL